MQFGLKIRQRGAVDDNEVVKYKKIQIEYWKMIIFYKIKS